MIYLLLGENSYARTQALDKLLHGREAEIFEGETLQRRDLPDIFAGQTLFSSERVIIINAISENKQIWDELNTWCERLDDTTDLILVEATVDKRTRSYKMLQKRATLITCDFWKANEVRAAEQWLQREAKLYDVEIAAPERAEMIARATRPGNDGKLLIDQLRLATVLAQLAGTTKVTRIEIDTVMAPSVHENIFALLGAALDGDATHVHEMVSHLSAEEDGHKALGLLTSQTVNLAALAAGRDRSVDEIAHELGVHPFALRSLTGYARKCRKNQICGVVVAMADADMRAKRGAGAWIAIETALQRIALGNQT